MTGWSNQRMTRGILAHSMDFARFVNLPSFPKLYRLIVNLSLRIVCIA